MEKDVSLYRTTQVVWYILYIIEGLLILRFILKLLGANSSAPFTQLIYGASTVFVAPFNYVFGINAIGQNVIEWSTILAMVVYSLIASAIVHLIVMGRDIKKPEAKRGLYTEDMN